MAREIYVGHLPETVTEEELRKLFAVVGEVTSIHLIIDPETREFKRCGYIRMAAGVDLNEVVVTLDGVYLIDREIHVSIARPQKPGMSGKGKPRSRAGRPSPRTERGASGTKPQTAERGKAPGGRKAPGQGRAEAGGQSRSARPAAPAGERRGPSGRGGAPATKGRNRPR